MAKPAKTGKSKAKARPSPGKQAKPAKKAKHRPQPATATATAAHAERFDRVPYELPVMDLGEAISLATALLAAGPAKPTPAIVEEARRVTNARDRAKSVAARGGADEPSTDARAYDAAMDRAWATFVRRIQDHIELPAAHHGHAPDAARIYAIVRDLSILKLNYLAEFAQIGGHLDAMKREGLLDAARTLAGTEFVDEVLRCHGEYGQALGLMGPPVAAAESDSVRDRGEARNVLIDSIAEYTVQVMALARAGRPDSWGPVHKALKPIAELRARVARTHRTHEAAKARPAHPPVVKPEPPQAEQPA